MSARGPRDQPRHRAHRRANVPLLDRRVARALFYFLAKLLQVATFTDSASLGANRLRGISQRAGYSRNSPPIEAFRLLKAQLSRLSVSSGDGTDVAVSRSMIPQTAVFRNEAQTAVASYPNRRVKGAQNWHALEASFVTRLLEVDPVQGLTSSEVATRRLRYGPNNSEALGSRRITGMLVLLFLSIAGFLLTAAILNSATADNIEAFAILVVVVVGPVVGFAHMLKAARALDAMRYATRATVRVRREGQETYIKAEGLVPGDIVILSSGDCVPADARLIETVQLLAQESALTGKSTAVEKRISQVVTDAPLEQRHSMVYLGTAISSGTAVAAVVATGVQTELGKRAACDH